MRKGLGLVSAISLLVSMGVWAAAPGGAATTLPTCKAFSGTQTYTPALPKATDTKKVVSVIATVIKITGCSGGGITSGSSTSKTKSKPENCATLIASAGKPSTSAGVIKWSNGKTSTTTNTLTQTSKPGVTPLVLKLVTKYTGGVGAGHSSSAIIHATLNKGACITAGLSKATFASFGKITSK